MSRARRTSRPARFSPVTRRDALKFLGGGALAAFADPIQILVRGLADGFVRQVMAESSGASSTPRNHVYVGLAGAPPRWLFDLPLSPYSSSETLPDNDGVVTRFVAGGGTTTSSSYTTATLTVGDSTLRMPHLWSLSIPICDSSGAITGTTPMTELLANTAIIRGIRGAGDGHPFLASKQLKPVAGAPSLGGQVADASEALLPAVMLKPAGMDAGTYYGSSAGTPLTTSGYTTNPLNTLLGGFNRGAANPFSSSGSLYSRRRAMDSVMQSALDLIAQSVMEAHPGSDALYASRSRAEAKLGEGIAGVATEYTALLAKYTALATYYNSWSDPACQLTGITDQVVNIDSTNPNAYLWNSLMGGYQIQGADLRTIIGAGTAISGLAIGFAVAEYLIKNGLSSSVAFFLLGCNYVQLDPATTYTMSDAVSGGASTTKFFSGTVSGVQQRTIAYDEHRGNGGGKHAGIILYTLQYLALSACIREFARSIGATLWGETILQVGSEFSRFPRHNGLGSEHAPLATVSSLFSGAIRKPVVVGNTTGDYSIDWRTTSTAAQISQSMQGHFGTGGLTTINGVSTHLVQGHLASTIAELLRVESPTSNNPSLLAESSAGVVSALDEQAKEVEE